MYNQSEKGGSKKWQGFSIVELLVVLAIIGIISSIIIPQVGGVLPNSKEVLAREVVEKLNRALKNHAQTNYQIKYPKNDFIAGDEILIVRTLQWRDEVNPASGSPYLRQDWHPVVSSELFDYRLNWNGMEFGLIRPSEKGVGIKLSFDGSDYGSNYQFENDYEPIGG